MNTHARMIEAALLAAVAMAFVPARAANPDPVPDPAPERIAIDCDDPVPPSQREVGELADQHNIGQVYATRQRVMAEVRRACQREGISAVLLVPKKQPSVSTRELRQIADNRPRAK